MPVSLRRQKGPHGMNLPPPATMGRQQLWAAIRLHDKACVCAWCMNWELRWTRAEQDTVRADSHV